MHTCHGFILIVLGIGIVGCVETSRPVPPASTRVTRAPGDVFRHRTDQQDDVRDADHEKASWQEQLQSTCPTRNF